MWYRVIPHNGPFFLKEVLKEAIKNDLTFEELFKDYNKETFTTELQNFSPIGNEKW